MNGGLLYGRLEKMMPNMWHSEQWMFTITGFGVCYSSIEGIISLTLQRCATLEMSTNDSTVHILRCVIHHTNWVLCGSTYQLGGVWFTIPTGWCVIHHTNWVVCDSPYQLGGVVHHTNLGGVWFTMQTCGGYVIIQTGWLYPFFMVLRYFNWTLCLSCEGFLYRV